MELPAQQVIRAVIQRYGRLVQRLQADLGQRRLILPNGDFFPDPFTADAASTQRLADRMREHAGMADIPVQVGIVGIEGEAPSKSCGSGSCGVPAASAENLERVVEQDDRWLLQVPEAELRHPVALTCNLARSLSYVFLVETKAEDELIEPPVEVSADLVGVALGFGPLLLQGSYIYAKSCGGPSVVRLTSLSCAELAIATGLFIGSGRHSVKAALRELDTTQRSLLGEAYMLFDSNRALCQKLRERPEDVAAGRFDIEESKSLLGRWFSRKRATERPSEDLPADSASLEELEALLIDMPPSSVAGRPSRPPPAPDPKRKEIVALVDEAFGSHAGAE